MALPGFFRALKWSVAGELASRAVQPLIFIILARILAPDAYGVMAAAVMVISFTQVFWEAGMSKALIQRQTQAEEAANVAFWINLLLGTLIAVILFFSSDFLAGLLFKDERVGPVLKVMTLQIFFGALSSVHTALLQKEMKFNKLFWVRMATIALPGMFSVPFALYGMSYWSLVAGTLTGQAIQVVMLWWIYPWRPKLQFDVPLAKELGGFGFWVGISGLLGWFYLWVDSLFVGAKLGTVSLGLYRTGNQFVTMIFGLLFTPLLPVLYSHFSLIQEDRERLKAAFTKVIRIVTLIAVPLSFILFSLADPISSVVFGTKWEGVGMVIGIMALTHGYSWIVGTNGEVYRAIGKPSYETVVSTIGFFIYGIGYYISIQYGFEVFVWTRYFLAMIALTLHITFAWVALRISVWSVVKVILLATGIGLIAPVVNVATVTFTTNPYLQILFTGGVSAIFMGGILFLLERNGLLQELRRKIVLKDNVV